MKLTLKQQRFADEYIISGNAEEAAIIAGYSEKYARGNAYKLVANSGIKKYIDERLSELEKKKIATQDEVLQYLTSVMRGEQTEQTLRGMGEGYQEITNIDVSAKDRIKAADILNKVYQVRLDKEESKEFKDLQKEKLRKEIQTDSSTEEKISELFEKIGGALNES